MNKEQFLDFDNKNRENKLKGILPVSSRKKIPDFEKNIFVYKPPIHDNCRYIIKGDGNIYTGNGTFGNEEIKKYLDNL